MVSSSSSSSAGLSTASGRITFGGIASGIDTNSIITALMAAGQKQVSTVQAKASGIQSQINAWTTLNSSLQALFSTLTPLADPKAFTQPVASVSPQSGDENKVAASVSSGAALQSFTFKALTTATATAVSSTPAIGAAISAGVPLDQAGFGSTVTAGTFSINGTQFTIPAATPSSVVSSGSIGATASATAKLNAANLTLTPATGSFSINGTSISYNATTDSLNDVIGRINSSSAGVTATYDDTAKTFTLTADTNGPAAITMADTGGGNFLQSMNLLDGGGATVGTTTAGTDLISLNDVITMINGAAIGVTASVVNDSGGRPNLLRLTSGAAVQVGAGGDSSNFLAVTSLLESPPGATRTSVRGLGQTQSTLDLQQARLATALTTATGAFAINGVTINWDRTSDSLQNVISKINASGAGVTATYDSFSDRLSLTANTTGSTAMTFSDTTGNLLASLGVLGATQSVGSNASYQINGGATRYSTSNTIEDAMPGVTLTVTAPTTSAVTVNVTLNTSSLTSSVNSFVEQYNSTNAMIASDNKYDPTNGNGILFGDPTLARMSTGLRQALTGSISGLPSGFRSLSDIGLSFGSVGSAIGSTDTLILNTGKFQTALSSDPASVGRLLSAFTAQASLNGGGTGSLASLSGTPSAAKTSGTYTVTSDGSGNLQAKFVGDDGGAPIETTGTITAGGTNTTLISGVTLTAKGTLVSGTDTITVSSPQTGFAKLLADYVNSLSRSTGLISSKTDEMQQSITTINKQVADMNTRLTAQQNQLQLKFSNMELAISKIQSQASALTSMQTQLNNIASSSKSK